MLKTYLNSLMPNWSKHWPQTDAAGVPTALETANPANLPIYGALGYAVTGTFDVTPDLRFWAMWRGAPA